MIRLDVKKMTEMRTVLERLRTIAEHIPEADRPIFANWIDQMIETIQALGMPLTVKSLTKAKEIVLRGEKWKGELNVPMNEFHGRFRDEMEGRLFFALAPGLQSYWDPASPLFGQEVHDAFPSSRFEVSEAGKCYALGRYTACVMHLMRALETPLTLQARELGYVPNRDSWGPILDEIEDSITNLKSADPRKEFHSAAATQFTFIKNAWRDAAMHQRGKYEGDDAEPILAAVRGLMRHLAKQLHE
ncbi:hypothetical protein [Usitatibacter palustris]|uniref:Uncharacterized protein n=1 Tax=Usitatibacter palustris TaxID=2732487 RepID=A0A6M4H615_9PROT|nr:hypothetical protein [Usitatibacter palustris]QJR15091.1 hypothetical protein DSM104440_01907 [Usitatibacter palustris]